MGNDRQDLQCFVLGSGLQCFFFETEAKILKIGGEDIYVILTFSSILTLFLFPPDESLQLFAVVTDKADPYKNLGPGHAVSSEVRVEVREADEDAYKDLDKHKTFV